jgi:hypothetical protein
MDLKIPRQAMIRAPKVSLMSTGQAYKCLECERITYTEVGPCYFCRCRVFQIVQIEECPIDNPIFCHSFDHDWSIGMHVIYRG